VEASPAAGTELPVPTAELMRQLAFAVAAVAAATLTCAALSGPLPTASLALIFLLAVLAVAVRSRLRVAVVTALLCSLSYNYFFTEPRFTLRIHSTHDVLAVVSFLVVALLSGRLASRLRAQVIMLRAANESARALQRLSERLTSAADEPQVLSAASQALAAALGAEVAVLRRAAEGRPLEVAVPPTGAGDLAPRDLELAETVAARSRPDGRTSTWLAATPWSFFPLLVEDRCLGVIALRLPRARPGFSDEQRRLAEAMTRQVALAADRTRLVHTLERARVEGETERLRAALLSSVSHDLRSPLASVIGAATSLSAYGGSMPASDRAELLEAIRTEAGRLDRYVQNLLDMTRLGAGGLNLQRDWVALDDIVGSALPRARKLFPETELVAELEPGLPLLWVHPALVEQALFNVLENAAKFSPPGAPVRLAAKREGDRLLIDVCDRGPGIPAEERQRIFDLFYSAARGDRGARGSGLGLAIVRGMIGAHGGRVEALEGPDGIGTRIRLTLPITETFAPSPAEDEE
jgi:two-component system sensor histidine kinase KdpD